MKRATIRDVAEAAGVSISTVHQALNGKSGVSQATRERICRLAEEMGYQPNALASGLKRKPRVIAVMLPSEGGNNRFYYPPIWRGVREYLESVADLNVETIELPYTARDPALSEEIVVLRELIEEHRIDGLLTVGHMDALSAGEWDAMNRDGIAVVQTGSDNALSHSLCCIQPDYDVIGRTMAELIFSRIPPFGSVVLCAGNPKWLAHSLVVRGFDAYIEENGIPNLVYRNYFWDTSEAAYQAILEQIRRPDVAACCSVLSQGSVLMGRALEESGKAGRLLAVGSDLSDESIDRLRRGVLSNILQKNPYAQGYLGAKSLVEYLVQGRRPEQRDVRVGSEVVFRSNLVMYDKGNYRSMLI